MHVCHLDRVFDTVFQSEYGGILTVITAFLPVFSCPVTNDFYIIDAKIYEDKWEKCDNLAI